MSDDANREDFKRTQLGREDDEGTHHVRGNDKVPRLYIIK